jgi:hypothetical protein
LAYTGSIATGSYTKIGRAVTFRAKVSFATVSNFGTSAYSISIPVLPESLVSVSFTGVLETPTDNYQVVAFASAESSAILNLSYLGTNGVLEPLTASAPATLTTSSKITLTGSYIANE